MQVTLLTAGLVCVIGAIIGGGLKAFEIEMPGIDSIGRQVLLGSVGVGLVAMSLLGVGAPEEDSPSPLANVPTETPRTDLPTGNLVRNPGAELGPVTAPFTPARAPEHWQQNALFAIAAAYGDFGTRDGCGDSGYPEVGQLKGSGERLFSGGYGAGGECNLRDGDTATLVQDIDVSSLGTPAAWSASAKLGGYPASTDGAGLTVLALDADGEVLDEETTGLVTNPEGDFTLKRKAIEGSLPDSTVTVRIVVSFSASGGFSGAFADDISFTFVAP